MNHSKNTKTDLVDFSLLEIRIDLKQSDAQILSRLIDENETLLHGLTGYYEVLYDDSRPVSERTSLHLYFLPEGQLPGAELRILLAVLGIDDFCIQEALLKEKDYLEAYKKYYTSFFVVPGIQIVPSWEIDTETATTQTNDSLPLYLDPGLAFGTGKHPSTQLCLAFLVENPPRQTSIVDAGCGSGILSIGALLLGAREVFAFDIDSNAVHSTKKNLALNKGRFAGSYQVKHGSFNIETLQKHPATLWIANLTASILVQNSEAFATSQAEELLLSGIILEQEQYVRLVYEKGWELRQRQEKDGWLVLHYKR